jgi:hypothetical protein
MPMSVEIADREILDLAQWFDRFEPGTRTIELLEASAA